MPQVVVEHVRKRDFKIDFTLQLIGNERRSNVSQDQKDLSDAVYLVAPSFLAPRLSLEIRQPVIGNIANTVIRLCQHGLPLCNLRTLMPNRPDMADAEECSHLVYRYREGEVIEQETEMCKDAIEGDRMLVHTVVLVFKKWRIETNVWEGQVMTKRRPALSVVELGRIYPIHHDLVE